MPFLSIAGATAYGWLWGVPGTNTATSPLAATVSLNAWHFLAITYTPSGASGTEKFYVDGALAGTATGAYSAVGLVDTWSTYHPGRQADRRHQQLPQRQGRRGARLQPRAQRRRDLDPLQRPPDLLVVDLRRLHRRRIALRRRLHRQDHRRPATAAPAAPPATRRAARAASPAAAAAPAAPTAAASASTPRRDQNNCGGCGTPCGAVTCASCGQRHVGSLAPRRRHGGDLGRFVGQRPHRDAEQQPGLGDRRIRRRPHLQRHQLPDGASRDLVGRQQHHVRQRLGLRDRRRPNGPIFGVTEHASRNGLGHAVPEHRRLDGRIGWLWQVNGNTPLVRDGHPERLAPPDHHLRSERRRRGRRHGDLLRRRRGHLVGDRHLHALGRAPTI